VLRASFGRFIPTSTTQSLWQKAFHFVLG